MGVPGLLMLLALQPVLLRAQATGGGAAAAVTDLKKLSVEDLMQVTVSSVARFPERLLDAPAAVEVISGDDIRRSGFDTIPDALRLADNLEVAQKDPHDWAISARGFNANLGDKLLVLMDGRSVYTPLFSGVFWNAQDYLLEDLDRIEVISGPGGTLWGANAVNGVINITSKNARDTQGTYVEAAAGSELQSVSGARYGGTLGPHAFFRVYGKYQSHDAGVLPGGAAADDGWRQGQAGFRIDAAPTDDNSATLQGDFYSGAEHLQGLGLARIAGGNMLGHWTHRFGGDSDLTAKVYYDRTHLSDPFGATVFQPAGLLVDDLDTYDADLQHRFWAGETHQIVWGAGFRLTADRIRQEAPNFGFDPPHLTQRLYSGFLQDEIQASPTVHLTVGSKLEHNDYTGWEVEPNLRARWEPTGQQTFWAAVSRAVRTPSRLDRDLAEPYVPPSLIVGSPDFKSETLVAEELGYRAAFGRRASVSVSLFYNQYDDLRGLALTPVTTLPLVYRNVLRADTYGAELSVDYDLLPWWKLHGGYTRLEEDVRMKPGRTDLQQALGETEDPRDQFSLRSSMDLPRNFEFDVLFRSVGTLQTNNFSTPGSVPAYAELDARLGWRPTDVIELSLVGRNLLEPHHPEYGFPGASREELQRGIYGKVALRF